MSKIIKITPECLDEIRKDFETALQGAKVADGKISFTKTFGYINRKATVYFSEIAWLKMQALIQEFDKEVAWHGVAVRGDDESKDEYYIKDILVYPQEVTGATVNTDQAEYEMWLMQNDDDVFSNIRMQGHSHVNMSTNPSGVDTTHQEKILEQLEDDMFYIFMIWNKKGEKTIKIYDLKKNVLFDGNDVDVKIKDDGLGLDAFIKNAKEMVRDKPFTSYGGYKSNTGYGYGSQYYSSTAGKSDQPADKAGGNNSSKKKKRKRKGKKTSSPSNAYDSNNQITMFHNDDDDIYGWYGYRDGYRG